MKIQVSQELIVMKTEVFRVAPMQPRVALANAESACCGVQGGALN